MGILARNKILVLMEAQSTWTLNILPRMLEYLGESFNRYLIETNQNVYGSKKVLLPKPELYVIYTGVKNVKERILSLNKEFFNNKSPIEIKVKVIVLKNSKSILKEYIEFSKVLDENNKEYGYTEKSINETIKYCIANEILKDYLSEYKKEVYNIMISAYSQEAATEMYGNERYNEGMKQGIVSILLKQFNDKKISAKEAADYLSITPEEFLELLK